MEKINVAELLKDCPKGMELDCTMFDNVTFVGVDIQQKEFPIKIKVGTVTRYLTKEGCYHRLDVNPNAKCVIFPKGKTTWEGFQRPFKNGDVLYVDCADKESDGDVYKYIFILKEIDSLDNYFSYCHLSIDGFFPSSQYLTDNRYTPRLATEEEKQRLFDAVKENGYKWNLETKTLEKLVIPKFKVGDWIVQKVLGIYKIVEVCESWYEAISYNNGIQYSIGFDKENDCHLWTTQDAKAGDVLALNWHEGDDSWEKIIIFKKYHNKGAEGLVNALCVEGYGNTFKNGKLVFHEEVPYYSKTWTDNLQPATKEEKEKLFDAIKANGFKWNAETKTLEKLIEPKVGIINLWIARDKSGDLYLYKDKPKRRDTTFDSNTGWTQWTFPSTFPEVTWENSPVEVELKLIEK